jgi:hypothetical protein
VDEHLRTATWVISSLLLLDQAGALDVSIVEHAPGTEGASSARSGPRGRVLTASAFSMLATKALLAWGGTTLWAIGKTPDRNEQKLGLHRTSTRRGKIKLLTPKNRRSLISPQHERRATRSIVFERPRRGAEFSPRHHSVRR